MGWKLTRIAALPVVLSVALAGCANLGISQPKFSVISTNYSAADSLIAQLERTLPTNSTVVMGTLVNVDALDSSSTLGRGVSEQIMSRFTHAGYRVVEMKFRGSVYMKRNEGELLLTREITEVAQAHSANAVIVGTYAVGGTHVYVNLKMIDPNSNFVMAATDYALPITPNVQKMLATRTKVGS